MFTVKDVDLSRVLEQLRQLSELGRTVDGGITRLTFSDAHLKATDLVGRWMEEADLEVYYDKWGNLFGRRSSRATGPRVLTGSHLDSVKNGGNFDGPLGVLSSLEAVRMIADEHISTSLPLEVVSFIEEEGSRFTGLLGSRLATGLLSEDQVASIVDAAGVRFCDALDAVEFPYPVHRDAHLQQGIQNYVELHIEQGRNLERAGMPIGIVTSIAGPKIYDVQLVGQADHAGTTEYQERRDALLAAAEIVTSVRKAAVDRFLGIARLTVGEIKVQPNTFNVIAGHVAIAIDSRATNVQVRNDLEQCVEALVVNICAIYGLDYSITSRFEIAPVQPPHTLQASIKNASDAAGLPFLEVTSWAAHDAMIMSNVSASGMIFVPCRDGRSHCPEEYVKPEHIAAGIVVLANSLINLAR